VTHDEAERLVVLIRSPHTRRKITEREWDAIADIILKQPKPKRPAHRPSLKDRDNWDNEASRIQRAQHAVAYQVIQFQKAYRLKHNCEHVPGHETNKRLDDEIEFVIRWMGIRPEQISKTAIRNVMRNGPSLRPRFDPPNVYLLD
jgi:hypothetical protein